MTPTEALPDAALDVGPLAAFGLTPEQESFRAMLREFVTKEIKPLADEAEQRREFPREVLPLLAERGLIGLKYRVEDGGQGGTILDECLLTEELTRAAAGLSAGVFAHSHLGIAPILHFGTDRLRDKYARPALEGRLIAGFGLTEPAAGSDVQGIQTRARRDGDHYVLDGSKVYITNGTIADYLVVAAYTAPGEGTKGISLFVVETNLPGITRNPLRKLGNWSSDTAEIFLDGVRVPAENRVGPEAGGFRQLMRTLTEGRIIVSTRGLALAEDAYERALAYAHQRSAFGRGIGQYQAVSHKLARAAVDIDAARLLIHRAAHLYMAGQECSVEASKAKYFATTVAQRVTTDAVHILGGAGYMAEFEVERLYRDAPESLIGEGTADIQLRVIAGSLGLRDEPRIP